MIQFSKEEYRLNKTLLVVAFLFIGFNFSNADSFKKHADFGVNHISDQIVNEIGFIRTGGGISYARHRLSGGVLFDASSSWILNNKVNPRNFEDRLGFWSGYTYYFRDFNKRWVPGIKVYYQFNSTYAYQLLIFGSQDVRFHDIVVGPSLLINFNKSFAFFMSAKSIALLTLNCPIYSRLNSYKYPPVCN